jgi:hypothetical protein
MIERIPQRVLMTADTTTWPYALDLIRALDEHHVVVALATMGQALTPEHRQEARLIPNLILFESTFKLEWMDKPWDDLLRAGKWLMQLETCIEPDVIHLNHYAHAALPWNVPVIVSSHLTTLSQWQAVRGEGTLLGWKAYIDLARKGLRDAQMLIAPSYTALKALKRHVGKLPSARVINKARDTDLDTPAVKERFIIVEGATHPLDSITALLPWPIYVIGPETTYTPNAYPLGELTPQERVSWLGRASLYAMPVDYDPIGPSVLEAALSGCALILGDTPGLRENWDGSAIFVPPDNPAMLQAAIETLIYDEDYRQAWAYCARIRALEFTPRRMASQVFAAYQEARVIKSVP